MRALQRSRSVDQYLSASVDQRGCALRCRCRCRRRGLLGTIRPLLLAGRGGRRARGLARVRVRGASPVRSRSGQRFRPRPCGARPVGGRALTAERLGTIGRGCGALRGTEVRRRALVRHRVSTRGRAVRVRSSCRRGGPGTLAPTLGRGPAPGPTGGAVVPAPSEPPLAAPAPSATPLAPPTAPVGQRTNPHTPNRNEQEERPLKTSGSLNRQAEVRRAGATVSAQHAPPEPSSRTGAP